MDAESSTSDMQFSSKSLIGKELIFFRSEYLLKKVKVPNDIQLEYPVQVSPEFYNQFARSTPAREYDENFVLSAPTIKLSEKPSRKNLSKRKTKRESLQTNDGELSVEIQKLFLREKIAF